MEAVLQTRGEDINIAATIDNVIPVEYGNINLDKFQAKLATGEFQPYTCPHEAYIMHFCEILY